MHCALLYCSFAFSYSFTLKYSIEEKEKGMTVNETAMHTLEYATNIHAVTIRPRHISKKWQAGG